MPPLDENDPVNRRGFFRGVTARLLNVVTDPIERRLSTLDAGKLQHLRPPGAIGDDRFAAVCQRCGECVKVCPASAIVPLSEAMGAQAGTPVVLADRAPCVVCEGLKCTHVCPSGALLPLMFPHEIQMGVAEVYADRCVRTSGESCTLCVDRCPIGATAIRFVDAGPPEVLSPGCVGCGVCQFYCPTMPKAIVVRAV